MTHDETAAPIETLAPEQQAAQTLQPGMTVALDGQGTINQADAEARMVEAERRLREMEERYSELETIFETMTDGIFVYDRDGRIVRMNAAARQVLHLESEPEHSMRPMAARSARYVLRDEHDRLLSQAEWPVARMLAGEVLAGEHVLDFLVDALDGRTKQLSFSGGPVRDAHGAITGAVGIYRDVTSRRHLAQRTQEALHALLSMAEALVADESGAADGPSASVVAQRLAELTRRVLGCERVSIQAIDPLTEVLRPIAVVGLAPELEQQWWDEQNAHPVSLRESMAPEMLAQLQAGEALRFDLTQPPYDTQPNPYGIITLLMAPMRIGDQLIGLLALDHAGVAHAYTEEELALASGVAKLTALVLERDRLLRERAESHGRELALQEANRQMDEFIGITGHELRNPLTSIKANIQLAERRLASVQKAAQGLSGDTPVANLAQKLRTVRDLLERADRQTTFQNRLVGDLLDVSRIQSDRLDLRLVSCDLATIVREVVDEQRLAWPTRTISLEAAADDTQPLLVYADPDRVAQVVTNYLTNALKYSANDLPVAVRVSRADGTAKVAVRDQGPGLPPAEQERIWERFHRVAGIADLSGSGVGLGLGLHISKSLITRQQGSVGVESAVGQGSTFWLTLPLHLAEDLTP